MLKRSLKAIFYTFLIISGVVFCVNNRASIDISLFPLPFTATLPLFLLAMIVFVVGVFLGWTICRIKFFGLARNHKVTSNRVSALENELTAVRSEQLIKNKVIATK